MEKYCSSCGRVFKDSDFKICPYCGNKLSSRIGRQPIPRKLRHQVFKRDGYRCRECGATNKQTRLHVDHIKPVARGGTNDLSNLQTLCEECNKSKYTDEWVGGVIGKRTPKRREYNPDDYTDTFRITKDMDIVSKKNRNNDFKKNRNNDSKKGRNNYYKNHREFLEYSQENKDNIGKEGYCPDCGRKLKPGQKYCVLCNSNRYLRS